MVIGGCDQWLAKLAAARDKQTETYETRYKHDHYVVKVPQRCHTDPNHNTTLRH